MADVDWKAYTVKELYKKYLGDIIEPLLAGDKIYPPASISVIITSIVLNLDLFGYLYTADPDYHHSSLNAVKFIREYLGRIDTRYKEMGGLLYHLLRHGWVHRFSSKRLKLSNENILDFAFGARTKREEHLVVKRGDVCRLFINLPVFCEDVLSAIDLYADDIHNNQDLSDIFEKAFYTVREPDNEQDIRSRGYLEDSDFDFIYRLLNEGH